MSSSWKTWSCKEKKKPLSRTDPSTLDSASVLQKLLIRNTKKKKPTPWYTKLCIFQSASVLWVQNRWKQEVLGGIDKVTTAWELDFKGTAYGCRIICQMKHEKCSCFLKIHFVLVLLHNTGICLHYHNWTKAYIMEMSSSVLWILTE